MYLASLASFIVLLIPLSVMGIPNSEILIPYMTIVID